MNLLFRVLYAQKCTSTHHMLAMDALRYLRCPGHEDWARFYLTEIEQYLDGSKAPDRKFRDYRSHVLHVKDDDWGNAPKAARQWYDRLVMTLRQQQFRKSAYCAGVLSHYLSDPLMPLHTGQSEDEGQVHKFIEWGTSKIYWRLVATHETARVLQNWKPPESPASTDWLEVLVQEGAEFANQFYDVLIDHYDPAAGQVRPEDGFDEDSRAAISKTLAWSIKAIAFCFDRAIVEAGVAAPRRRLGWSTFFSTLSIPLLFVSRRLKDRADRVIVMKMWDEFQETGKVIETLPIDERCIREWHANEVLGIPVVQLNAQPVRRAGLKRVPDEQPVTRDRLPVPAWKKTCDQFWLDPDDDVIDAPSIGKKTAARLQAIGIYSVRDLIDANPDDATDLLDVSWLTLEKFQDWQAQAILMIRIPGLRGHDAQVLVAVNVTRPAQLQDLPAGLLLNRIQDFAATDEGQRILSGSTLPDLAEIHRWQAAAGRSRNFRAA